MEGLGLWFVANHFDVVPVRTNDESCIVVRAVLRAETRCTIVFATRLQSRAIESFDLLAILGRERQVKLRWLLPVWYRHNEALPFGQARHRTRRPLRDNSHAERFECLEEERFARRKVADSEFDVVKHTSPEVCGPAQDLTRIRWHFVVYFCLHRGESAGKDGKLASLDPKPEFDSQGKFCHAPAVNFYSQFATVRARRVAGFL